MPKWEDPAETEQIEAEKRETKAKRPIPDVFPGHLDVLLLRMKTAEAGGRWWPE